MKSILLRITKQPTKLIVHSRLHLSQFLVFQLRKFFEVNRHYVVVAALKALADLGEVDSSLVAQAIKVYKIDPEKPNPATV